MADRFEQTNRFCEKELHPRITSGGKAFENHYLLQRLPVELREQIRRFQAHWISS